MLVPVDLISDCLSIALDTTEEIYTRRIATIAVKNVGSSDDKEKLKPLVIGNVGKDPDDDLKGYGLEATWPEILSSDEFFSSLSIPKRKNYLGSYIFFIHKKPERFLKNEDFLFGDRQPNSLKPMHSSEVDD